MSDINIGAITEALNDKSDRDLRNVDTTAKADAVIDYQEPTSANNYTWYRKYKSGWIEQGQGSHVTSGTTLTIVLPVEMANADYNVSALGTNPVKYQNTTITQFELVVSSGTWISWEVKGIAAN